ncbi:hypothetical protein D9613_000446 [Agrocybe pediades]|uniref:EXS domain-containing protein n=1 Tax=Agrocybe pediades TaxID=84607 RepID=A0A8H4R2M6_9AGAR|nr:hypothetical protein D9613_000446 [Agrocybe pediades]
MVLSDAVEVQYHVLFPLPYRVLFLFGLGILAWATILHGLHYLGVDTVSVMDLKQGTDPMHSAMPTHRSPTYNQSKAVALYNDAYRIFFTYSSFCFASWVAFRMLTRGEPARVDAYGYLPVITAVIIVIILLCPYRILFHHEREKFTLAIRRCVFPAPSGPIYFSDVIFADIGTSFAKVFGELLLSLCMLKPGNSILNPPVEDSWMRWVFPIVIRQFPIPPALQAMLHRRPLMNALKYATSFPVIFLSAAQRMVVKDIVNDKGKKMVGQPWHGEHPLFRLWLLAAAINSLYSFWWDITNDWGLDLLRFSPEKVERQPPRPLLLSRLHSTTPLINRQSIDSLSSEEKSQAAPVDHPLTHRYRQSCFGLRPVLLYPRAIYPVLIFVNLLLRMSWSIKLSTYVHSSEGGSVAFFWLQVLELFRRWLWVFLRVEWEAIKKAREPRVATAHADEDDPSGDEGDYEMLPNTPEMSNRT